MIAISRDQFYYWKRGLKESCLASALPDIVPLNLPISDQGCTTCTTLATPVPDPESIGSNCFISCTTSPITLRLDEISIEISAAASDDLVCRVIKAVRHDLMDRARHMTRLFIREQTAMLDINLSVSSHVEFVV